MHPKTKPGTAQALSFLITPMMFGGMSLWLFGFGTIFTYWSATLLLSLFFTQTFILLHECAHLQFFVSRRTNIVVGNLMGLLSGIPFVTWQQMHNLHHKWTGWRDLDPTTEKTVEPSESPMMRWVANICWLLFIPIFYLVYVVSNYWNIFKIRRFVAPGALRSSVVSITVYALFYVLAFVLFSPFILHYLLPAFGLSCIWKELIILTQHSHIEIPVSGGNQVRPLPYSEQIPYTRSFRTHRFLARYFLFNFNLHQAHHAYPGLPAYWLDMVEVEDDTIPTYSEWFRQAKSLKGEDYIFRTSKHTGRKF